MRHPAITLCVLAGGAATRMGGDKPAFEVSGQPMIDWVLAAAGDLPTLVVGRPHPRAPWVSDSGPPRRGPLAGLVAALATAPGAVLLVGADQPWLRPDTVAALAGLTDEAVPVIPVDGGVRQVLCAVYPPAVTDRARALLDGRAGLQALAGLGCREVDPETWLAWGEDGRSWYSVDTPGGAAAGLDRYGPPR